MEKKKSLNVRLICTSIATLLIWGHLAWDYYQGGVPMHYLYIFEGFPGISNWWGGLVIPLLTWFSLGLIHKRVHASDNNKPVVKHYPKSIVIGFVGALFLGILISISFAHGNTSIPGLLVLAMLPLALFIPIYRAEYLLGFVLGMTYIFGPILPIGMGVVLMILFAVTYKYIRPGILCIASIIKG